MKSAFVYALAMVVSIRALNSDDVQSLIEGIKKINPQQVHDVLQKRTIDCSACGDFDYLDFACCKLTVCLEKIEQYKIKHHKWEERIGSVYDQDLVTKKIEHYKALTEKWLALKKQVQSIVQMIAIYLGLTQATAQLTSDLAGEIVDVAAGIEALVDSADTHTENSNN